MKFIVTGAAGFIGSHVVRQLLEQKQEVYGVVRPGTQLDVIGPGAKSSSFCLIEKDLAGIDAASILQIEPDVAIHLAWFTKPDSYWGAVEENLRSLEVSAVFMRALVAGGCPRLVIAGSFVEADPTPRTLYAAAKQSCHLIANQLGESGLSAVCAHIFHVYGEGEKENRLVPMLVRELMAGRRVNVTAGEQEVDYLNVVDVASALVAIAGSDIVGSVDVCSGSPVALREVFEIISEQTGLGHLLNIGGRPYDAREGIFVPCSSQKLTQTGWRPSISLADGLSETVARMAGRHASSNETGG